MSERKIQIDAWKVFRIISEFVEGFEMMTDIGPSVSLFGSARVEPTHPYYEMTRDLAYKISKKGFGVITGGGPGLMEAANKGASEAGGVSCGLSIELPHEMEYNPYVDRKYKICLRYFFVRKVMFLRYAQAFIFLPGGYGTLDELFETLTLVQTNRTKEFPIYMIGKEYWKGLLDWVKASPLEHKFINSSDLEIFTLTDDIDEVVDGIVKWHSESGQSPTFELGPD